jgi:hypothetical protein
MCLGDWSLCGLVKDKGIFAVTCEAEVEGEEELLEGWDSIAPMLVVGRSNIAIFCCVPTETCCRYGLGVTLESAAVHP